VQKAVATSRAHGVTFPQPGGLAGGCDLVHFHDVGAMGIVLGPGSLNVAHQPDEFVPRTISPAPLSSTAISRLP
jgi:acetylornithine deacetylase/succinyl-diaminopimelate desuccinylase